MTIAQQEHGGEVRGGLPTALRVIIGLLLIDGAWQGWTLARWRLHDSPDRMVFGVMSLLFTLAPAWGLWRRKAWGWWLAAALCTVTLSMFALGGIGMVWVKLALQKAPGGGVSGFTLFAPSLLVGLTLSAAELMLLLKREVLASITGKPQARTRRMTTLGLVGCLGPVLLMAIIFMGTFLVFPLLPRKWRQGGILSQPGHFSVFDHVEGTATRLRDGRILLAGWQAPDGGMTAEFYTPDTNAFSPAPAMPNARTFDPVATLLKDGRVLVAGGMTPSHGWVEAIDIYDPEANTWATPGKVSPGTRIADAVALLDGGALLTTEEGGARAVLRFDPGTGSLEPVGPRCMVVNGTPLATLLQDGKVLITHLQYGAPGSQAPNAFLFDPVSRTTMPLPRMAQDRSQHQATRLQDGRVLITGGAEGAPSAEWYDPKKGLFEPAGELLAPRVLHRAVPLADGRVLILGGVASRVDLQPDLTALLGKSPEEIRKMLGSRPRPARNPTDVGCELFDPATRRFSKVPPPPFLAMGGMGPRTGVQVVLPDGRVLLMGRNGPLTFDPQHLTWNPVQPIPSSKAAGRR